MLVKVALFILGVVLFVGAHPNYFFKNGLFLLGYVALVPVFILIKKSSLKKSCIIGFFYAFLSYSFYAHWLFNYSTVMFFSAILYYSLLLTVTFLVMKLCTLKLCNQKAMYVMALVWCVSEYLRTLGPIGFSYGIIGYTQWQNPLMLSMASICGVWVASSFCAFVSAFVSSVCIEYRCIKVEKHIVPFSLIVLAFIFAITYNYRIKSLYSDDSLEYKSVKVMAVQNNTDSNKNGFDVYKKDIRKLINLTKNCSDDSQRLDFVLWPETAVVPPLMYYYNNRIDPDRFNIIVDVLDVMSKKDACFVIGNQHSEKNSEGVFSDYNAALVFDGRMNDLVPPSPGVYKKIHLVPFSEYIPLSLFSFIADETNVWNAGTSYNVFTRRNLCFCTPICFEDTFGSFCRKFVKNGAECFFELSNDSWAQSSVSQHQHLSMAVFRSAENNVPAVRCSGSGISCYIDEFGHVEPRMIEEFAEGSIVYDVKVPVKENLSFYTVCGDWFAIIEICILLWLCFSCLLMHFIHVEKK